jgi:hypothetical protein
MARSQYAAGVVCFSSGECIAVVDLNSEGARSVTNDAEAVVAELARRFGLHERRVFYRDSMGVWDELKHDGARFTAFAAGCPRDLIAVLTDAQLESW